VAGLNTTIAAGWRRMGRIIAWRDGTPVAGLDPCRMSEPVLAVVLAAPAMLNALYAAQDALWKSAGVCDAENDSTASAEALLSVRDAIKAAGGAVREP
jgi:hypothetical protein